MRSFPICLLLLTVTARPNLHPHHPNHPPRQLSPRTRYGFLDDELIHDVPYPKTQSLYPVASRAGGDGVLTVVNVSDVPRETLLNLSGVPSVKPHASAIVLTSAHDEDENSLDQPTKVTPAASEITAAREGFTHLFLPNSDTMLRIGVQ